MEGAEDYCETATPAMMPLCATEAPLSILPASRAPLHRVAPGGRGEQRVKAVAERLLESVEIDKLCA